jgi:hypothetical protein
LVVASSKIHNKIERVLTLCAVRFSRGIRNKRNEHYILASTACLMLVKLCSPVEDIGLKMYKHRIYACYESRNNKFWVNPLKSDIHLNDISTSQRTLSSLQKAVI